MRRLTDIEPIRVNDEKYAVTVFLLSAARNGTIHPKPLGKMYAMVVSKSLIGRDISCFLNICCAHRFDFEFCTNSDIFRLLLASLLP